MKKLLFLYTGMLFLLSLPTIASLDVTGKVLNGYNPATNINKLNNSHSNNAGQRNSVKIGICGVTASITQTNVTCYGGANGSASVSPSGGVSPYTYSWSPSGGTGAMASGLAMGVYTVTVTDNALCTATVIVTITQPAAPVTISVSVLPSTIICSGASVAITPTGAGTYSITGGSFTVTPQITTSYSVTGTGTNNCATSNTIVTTISVNITPTLSVNSATLCSGNSVAITPTGAGSYTITGGSFTVAPTVSTSYSVTGTGTNNCASSNTIVSTITVIALPTVSLNSGAVCPGNSFTLAGSGASTYTYSSGPVVSPATNTTYSVTGTSSSGCVSANIATASVIVYTLPVLSINGPSVVCDGSYINLSASGANTYTWDTGANTSSIVISPSTVTTYSVMGTNTNNCVGSASVTININATPQLSITGANAVCTGSTLTLSASGASTYFWWNNIAATASISVSPTVNTTYSVTGVDVNGCRDSIFYFVTVLDLPIVTITGNSVICEGQPAFLTGNGALAYVWSNGSISDLTSVTPSITTTYSVTGTDLSGCMNSAVQTITVNALPAVLALSSSSAICAGEIATLTASGAASYLWNNGVASSSIFILPILTTTYSVIGTATNGCANSATITQKVSDCVGISSVSGNTAAAILVYPNPNNGQFIVEAEESAEVVVVNCLGQIVHRERAVSATTNVSIDHLDSGIYFVKTRANGRQHCVRIIKE